MPHEVWFPILLAIFVVFFLDKEEKHKQ